MLPFIHVVLLVVSILEAHLDRQAVNPLAIWGLCVKGKVVPALQCRGRLVSVSESTR